MLSVLSGHAIPCPLADAMREPLDCNSLPIATRFRPARPNPTRLERFRELGVVQDSGDAPRMTMRSTAMLGWALTFLIVALIAAVLGFGGIAGFAVEIAKIIFFVAIILFVISAIVRPGPRPFADRAVDSRVSVATR